MSTGQLTAREIIDLMRFYMQETGTDRYRDGFTTDASTSSSLIPLLLFANQAQRLLGLAGFYTRQFTQATASGTAEYLLDGDAGKVSEYTYTSATAGINNKVLRDVTVPDLQRRVPGYRATPAGEPNVVMTMGRYASLWPAPGHADGQLRYWAAAPPPALPSGNPAALPSGLPNQYHGAIPMLGAVLADASDADNEGAQARAQSLIAFFEMQYPELKDTIDARAILGQRARQMGDE